MFSPEFSPLHARFSLSTLSHSTSIYWTPGWYQGNRLTLAQPHTPFKAIPGEKEAHQRHSWENRCSSAYRRQWKKVSVAELALNWNWQFLRRETGTLPTDSRRVSARVDGKLHGAKWRGGGRRAASAVCVPGAAGGARRVPRERGAGGAAPPAQLIPGGAARGSAPPAPP